MVAEQGLASLTGFKGQTSAGDVELRRGLMWALESDKPTVEVRMLYVVIGTDDWIFHVAHARSMGLIDCNEGGKEFNRESEQ